MTPGRNDACPCGSGSRFKHCCGRLPGTAASDDSDVARLLPALQGLLHGGQNRELEFALQELLRLHPQHGPLWQLLGIALSRQGKDSIPALLRAVACAPGDATAQVNLANALARANRLPEARSSYARALELDPNCAEAHANLAQVHLELRQPEQALDCARRALALNNASVPARLAEAAALLLLGRIEEAANSSERALACDPHSAEAYDLKGSVLLARGVPQAAIAQHERALALRPELAEAHANRARALGSLGHLDEAIAGYRRALELKPAEAALHTELATVLRLRRRPAEAEQSARDALAITPDSPSAYVALAEVQADWGRFSEAEALYRRALALDEACAEAWLGLARVRRCQPQDEHWLETAARVAAQPMPARREMLLHYALGKCRDDLGHYERAFGHFARANELAKSRAPAYDGAGFTALVDRILSTQDSAWLNRVRPRLPDQRRPVFIVGMLRSGTTLAEQILASHPEVFGAGELTFWGDPAVAAIAGPGATEVELRELGERYLGQLALEAPADARYIVDKLPTNFLWLGVIRAALPGARFIHLMRDPRDTCLSIYFQNFEAINAHTHDLADLAHYYRQYRRLMTHWRRALPGEALLEVPYEELVRDTEGWTRRMLEFLDLPWHPGCLESERTERQVITASRWQVRQRIYSSSVARWRGYSGFLGPLAELARPPR